MKCSKCNSQLKEGTRFCTSCGTAVEKTGEVANYACANCNAPLKEGARFCTSCGTKVEAGSPVVAEPSLAAMSTVKQKIFWDIQPGEIARRVNEVEFIQYDSAVGIIINDGTSAYIRSDGKQIAELHGGSYDFVDPEKLDKILESRTGGLAGGLKKGFRGLINAVLGQKIKDRMHDLASDPACMRSLDELVEYMRNDSLLSLTLKLDKDFELLFGATHATANEYADFEPMVIKTKYLDVNVGVRAFFRITDFGKFASHYLSNRSQVSTSFLADNLSPIVWSAIQEVMYDVELSGPRIPADIQERLKDRITQAANNFMYGISLEKVVEISIEDKDLERFRALSRELYLSEQELDYLVRANDFKNRLNLQVDDQELYDTRRVAEKERRLNEINRDMLLNRDEFERFTQLLALEARIREAKNDDELEKARHEIAINNFQREHALFVMQQRGASEIEDIELERVRKARLGMVDIEVGERRLRDDYELDKASRVMDLDNCAAESSLERLRKIKEMERAEEEARHNRELKKDEQDKRHQLDLRDAGLKELAAKQNLTPEQLMAIAINENMDPVAAAKFAESFSARFSAERQAEYMAERDRLNDARIADRDREADRMERMVRDMMAQTTSLAGKMIQSKDDSKNEYKERLYREQDRHDTTQARALDYATRNNAIGKETPVAPAVAPQGAVYHVDIEGKEHLSFSLPQLLLMTQKGMLVADTLVYSSGGSNWVAASKLKELTHLFAPSPAGKGGAFCQACNSEILAGMRFCEVCGTQVG